MRAFIITLIACLAFAGAALYFLELGPFAKDPFNPDAAASEIQARIGSGPSSLNFTTSIVCSNTLPVSSKVCAGHRKTAHEVRTEIDQVIRGTDAEPLADWSSNSGWYSRSWRYGDFGLNTFRVIIMNDAITIDW